jgi:chemotaxis methyl-accepting protein methylase
MSAGSVGLGGLDTMNRLSVHRRSSRGRGPHRINAVATNKTDFFRELAHFD